MKKNLFISSAIALSATSFSFYRMEGPYNSINYPEILPYRALQSDPDLATIFLYDQNTHLRLEYTFENKVNGIDLYPAYRYESNIISIATNRNLITKDTITSSKFFSIEFKYNKTFWKDNKFISNYIFQDYLHGDFHSINYYSVVKQKITSPKKEFENTVNMCPKFRSSSGVWIDNTKEEVILSCGKKSISLKKALLEYFNSPNFYTNFANIRANCKKIIRSSISLDEKENYYIKNVEPFSYRFNYPILSDESFLLLNESKILAVWCLVPDGLGRESQLIGLAEDKEGKLFHWATDLEEDFSVLIPKQDNYYIKQLKDLMWWGGKQACWAFEKFLGLKGLY